MRFVATLALLLAFALVRPLAGPAEGLGPCLEPAASAMGMDMADHAMMDHAMMDQGAGAPAHAPETPAPDKAPMHACASACCASPAVVPAAGAAFIRSRQPAFLAAAVAAAATPVPHAPDLRPPIA